MSWDNSTEQLNETSDSMDEKTMSSVVHETSPYENSSCEVHTLPILKKILDLSTKAQVDCECWFICCIIILLLLLLLMFCGMWLLCMFQDLKKEHVSLRNQVKLTFESFADLGVLKSIQLLGKALTYA